MSNYGSRFSGVKPEVDKPKTFEALPWGWYTGKITAIDELPNGDLVDITIKIMNPQGFADREVKFINIYCGEMRWDKKNEKLGTARNPDYVHRQKQHVAKLIEAVGYADLTVNPKLKATHKPIEGFANIDYFRARVFLCQIGQEEYESKGQVRVKNTLDGFAWWDGKMVPPGPDADQPEPRRDNRGARAPADSVIDYSDTGIEHDPGPPPDWRGGYDGGYSRTADDLPGPEPQEIDPRKRQAATDTPPWVQ